MKLSCLYLLLESQQKLAAVIKMINRPLTTATGKKLPDMSDFQTKVVADRLIEADPTNHKEFSLWLTKLFNKKVICVTTVTRDDPGTQIRLPEDEYRVQGVLTAFARARLSRRLPAEHRDITKFNDFYSMEDIITALSNAGKLETTGLKAREVPGAQIIYNTPPYTVYIVPRVLGFDDNGLLEDIEKLKTNGRLSPSELTDISKKINEYIPEYIYIDAVGKLGMGPPETQWCTRAEYGTSYATQYLASGPMVIVYKDGKPFIQKNLDQIMDVNDRHTTIPPELQNTINKAEQEIATINMPELMPEGLEQFCNKITGLLRLQTYPPQNAQIPAGYGIRTTYGTIINYLDIADMGNYYFALVTKRSNPTTKLRRGLTKSQKQLVRLGWATAEYIAKTPEERQAREKAIKIAEKKVDEAEEIITNTQYLQRQRDYTGGQSERHTEMNKVRLAYNQARRELKNAEITYKFTNLSDKTITINKTNVAEIGDPVETPNP